LVLRICGYSDEERMLLSDRTCTALQLANHWQDVRRDWDKGRVYLPLDVMSGYGYSVEQLRRDIEHGAAGEPFRRVLADLCNRAAALFAEGLPLVDHVDGALAADIDLFSRGGMGILERIAAQNYDVIRSRPVLSKGAKAALLLGAVRRRFFRSKPSGEAQHAYR
jgi:phytoene/squalene synthetase